MCPGRKVSHSSNHVRALEVGIKPKETGVQKETKETEDIYLYQVANGKSRNPAMTLEVNSIPVTLHLEMQADVTVITEKHFDSLKSTSPLQPTDAVIRSFSGDDSGPALALAGCFQAIIHRNQKSIQEVV